MALGNLPIAANGLPLVPIGNGIRVRGDHQIQQFLRFQQLLLKITSGLKNSPGYLFSLKKFKNDIKIVLKPTGIMVWENLIKIYYAVYVCEKNDATLKLSKPFFNQTFLNTINLIC